MGLRAQMVPARQRQCAVPDAAEKERAVFKVVQKKKSAPCSDMLAAFGTM
jgi:hypothetical protein